MEERVMPKLKGTVRRGRGRCRFARWTFCACCLCWHSACKGATRRCVRLMELLAVQGLDEQYSGRQ